VGHEGWLSTITGPRERWGIVSDRVSRAVGRRSGAELRRVYERLLRRFGHAGWWPGETALEICLGAILVQNTSWKNVERALSGLRRRGLVSHERLAAIPPSRLAPLVRSSGYFRVKARRVRAFLDFLGAEYGGRVEAMRKDGPKHLREKLLRVVGIGPETADSIILYAVGYPVFVVDAYTRRIFSRLGWIGGDEPYDVIQALFTRRLPADPALYNDFHAQIVSLGKDVCRKVPRCSECPLDELCPKRGL
jgi:endonuclease-3 related protein